jgi:hypothetical protein
VVFTNGSIVSFAAQEFDADLMITSGENSVKMFPYKYAKGQDLLIYLRFKPVFWRATPTLFSPFFRKPVSSTRRMPVSVGEMIEHLLPEVNRGLRRRPTWPSSRGAGRPADLAPRWPRPFASRSCARSSRVARRGSGERAKKILFVCTANICRHCIRLQDVM